jgi:hypothetical protein
VAGGEPLWAEVDVVNARLRTWLAAVLVCLVVFGAAVAPAHGDLGGGVLPPGAIWAGVGFHLGGSSGTGTSCTWTGFGGDTTIDTQSGPVTTTTVIAGVTYRLYLRSCPGGAVGLVWIPELTPPGLSQQARSYLEALLPRPVVATAPPAAAAIVGVGMWFWTDPSRWRPVSVTAWVPTPTGILWATTTAVPSGLEFVPGDGSTPRRCGGPGDRWTGSAGDRVDPASGCVVTYHHASSTTASGTWDASLAIDWTVTWVASTGQRGVAPMLRTEVAVPVTVREIQALGV